MEDAALAWMIRWQMIAIDAAAPAGTTERAKALFEADVIAAAELQRRQSEYQISVAETRAAADQLQLLGVTPAAIERFGKHGAVNSLTPVVATLSGVVVERKLAQGQVVQPADALFVVADLSNLWAVAQVPSCLCFRR